MTRTYKVNGETFTMTQAENDDRDLEEKAWADGATKRNALAEIEKLEGTITPRRLRDSVLTDEGKAWLTDVEAKIATERGKL
jgi:ribosomal protein S19E (S16A)